jgi:hypothetical protein
MKRLLEKWNRFLDNAQIPRSELKAHQVPFADRKLLLDLERVETIRKKPLRFALTPVAILWCFTVFICILAKLWLVILIATGLGLALFIMIVLNSPSYCPKCGREMDTKRPPGAGIWFDVCNHCGCYSNLHAQSSGD